MEKTLMGPLQPLQIKYLNASPASRALTVGASLALAATLVGGLLAVIGPLYTTIALVALGCTIWATARLEHSVWSVLGVIALLPFATLPVKIVLTPTFLDLALAAVFGIYLAQWITRERRQLLTTPVHVFVILFMILSLFSFVAGLRYAGLTSNVARKFAELLLSMVFCLVLVDIIRTPTQLRQVIIILLIVGTIAATIGIVLWVLPDQIAETALSKLAVVGYPNSGIIQYVEQNPELPERAISTSVNPNSLGGFLVMVAALAAPQIMTRFPSTGKRWHAFVLLAPLVGCLVLTFSRGSMAAFGVALLFSAALRYRRLLLILLIIGLIILILPWSQPYVQRFAEGLQGADLATQMRFGEYTDALTLVARYPWLGVGFSGTPDIDTYLGVASVYLTIAENMGLIGLAAFSVLMIAVFSYAWQARPFLARIRGLHPIWLGLMAGLVGALVGGLADHYFFNLEFQHAITIFWIFVGLLLAATRIALESNAENAKTRSGSSPF